ncbi:dephospho-CoA kinase [Leptolyngbya sp. FACHB-261]|uniref:dephospho-CoA kinase n=1 Tax=Leptolyngbya sp. FACHB-261 TaxID=2692806 RepID=UPI0016846B16|nr:dephospho-CoA kinase [Leptolyngbya sp. FACHB-261]MBD2103195.1 dephospho-CoA kinase [Leptolyngbya sp. FACHB-261]
MPERPGRIIGLTGGVSTGKSTVSAYLSQRHQLPIIDADLLAREAVRPGSPVLQQIVERYGNSILLTNGELDRRRLGEIVFATMPERTWLEQQIHPYVRDQMQTQLARLATCPLAVLVVPLLFEARMDDLATETWVVFCPEPMQLQRLMNRDQLDAAQAQARIAAHMPLAQKVAHADVVLWNQGALEDLYSQVDRALEI